MSGQSVEKLDLSRSHILRTFIGGGFTGHGDTVDYALDRFPDDLFSEARDIVSRLTDPEILPTLETDGVSSDHYLALQVLSGDGVKLCDVFNGYFKPTPLVVDYLVEKLFKTDGLSLAP